MFNRKEYKAAFSKVTASQELYDRVLAIQNIKPKRRRIGLGSKVLIAAVLVSLLAVTVSASESSWFTKFFGIKSELRQEQVAYLEEKTQKIEPASTAEKKQEQDSHKDVLQFIKEMTVCSADQNNTHITKEGQPSFHDIKLDSLTLSETEARLEYYYYEDMDGQAPCSMENITVVFRSGEEAVLPITDSVRRRMTFTSSAPLDLSNVSYIRLPDGLILYPINKVDDGYCVSIDSVMTDGTTAYITLNVTIPEVIQPPGNGWTMDNKPNVSFWICPADQEKPTIDQTVMSRGSSRILEDDGDGKDNTYKQVSSISYLDGTTFANGSRWKLHVEGFSGTWHNAENQKLIDEKYAGQDYLIDGEEAAMTFRFDSLCWDTWDFEFTFAGDAGGTEAIEMVKDPVLLSGLRGITMEEARIDPQSPGVPYEAELTSFIISPFTYTITYTDITGENHAGSFDPGEYTLVMKDGKELTLFPYHGCQNFDEPIILSNIDYLLMPNGEKLAVPE